MSTYPIRKAGFDDLSPERQAVLRKYAQQCHARHLEIVKFNPRQPAPMADTSTYIDNCAKDAFRAILDGRDTWRRIIKSVNRNS